MEVKETTVRKILITGVEDLDPVNVYIEEYTPTSGKITIECFSQAWSYFWGSIGEMSIMEFFCSCDNHYLSSKFAPHMKSEIDDYDRLPEYAREHIIERRKCWEFEKDTARDLYDKAKYLEQDNHDLMFEIFGEEWWYNVPKQPNHQYEYLGRILDASKKGVKTLIPEKVGDTNG